MNSLHEAPDRRVPNLVIHPRWIVQRLETGTIQVDYYARNTPPVQLLLTSRSAHELFEELVGALSKEGRPNND